MARRVFFYFDGAAAEISSGPDAGYYLCPFDYYATDRPGNATRLLSRKITAIPKAVFKLENATSMP